MAQDAEDVASSPVALGPCHAGDDLVAVPGLPGQPTELLAAAAPPPPPVPRMLRVLRVVVVGRLRMRRGPASVSMWRGEGPCADEGKVWPDAERVGILWDAEALGGSGGDQPPRAEHGQGGWRRRARRGRLACRMGRVAGPAGGSGRGGIVREHGKVRWGTELGARPEGRLGGRWPAHAGAGDCEPGPGQQEGRLGVGGCRARCGGWGGRHRAGPHGADVRECARQPLLAGVSPLEADGGGGAGWRR